MRKPQYRREDQRNLWLAVVISAVFIVAWQFFVEVPKRQELAKWNAAHPQKSISQQVKETIDAHNPPEATGVPGTLPAIPLEDRLAATPRVRIESDKLGGSISLKGLRFDDISLLRYHATPEPDSPRVRLLSPAGDDVSYFMEASWLSPGNAVAVPDANTVWTADRKALVPGKPVTFRWDNGTGVQFIARVSIDDDYMFSIEQRVENHGGNEITVVPYAYVNRAYNDMGHMHYAIMHEGPLGMFDGTLTETQYKKLREEGPQTAASASGWLGFTDKYWLTALIPDASSIKTSFSYYQSRGLDRYQAEYTQPSLRVPANGSESSRLRFFAGAKEIEALDRYADGKGDNKPIPLFDRAVDFGSLYFLTKPMFLLLNFFYSQIGNFGIAILLLTLVIKGLMYPVANKGYHATTQLRALQPEMLRIRENFEKDRVRLQQEMLALYKREKVNPAAGCLPVLIQIPVFFALYKVLFVTIEMRHAPFFGWLRDLSAADPSNLFTAFGMIPWDAPSWLHIGLLPILMGVTMKVQMMQQPKPTDPTQAKIITWMPFFLTIVLASMPAGLVLYWTCSNVLSILQQWVITKRYEARQAAKQAGR